MKERILSVSILLISVWVMLFHLPKAEENYGSIPALPQPIGKETVLITSAGQSSDTNVIKDMANEMMIHNYFMPKATGEDLEKTNAVIIVFGYSPINAKQQAFSAEDELNRVQKLIDITKNQNKPLIGVFIGEKARRIDETNLLLEKLMPQMNYIITTTNSDYDNFIYDLSMASKIPITITESVFSISESLVSIFR